MSAPLRVMVCSRPGEAADTLPKPRAALIDFIDIRRISYAMNKNDYPVNCAFKIWVSHRIYASMTGWMISIR